MKAKTSVFLVLSTIFCCIGFKQALAQIDPHFTQNYMYPMAVNPALTGAMDGSYRVSSIYRNQWNNIMNPYSTVGFSAELATDKNINFGTSFFKQTVGDAGFQQTSANISIAYSGVKFGSTGDQRIAFGLQAGLINARFDVTALKFGNQWLAGAGYVPGLSAGETLESLSSVVPDINFGISYFDNTPRKKIAPFGGLSVYHITKPTFSFYSNGTSNKLPVRYSAQAGTKIALTDGVHLVSHIVYNRQQKASELITGAYAQFFVNEDIDFMLGGNMRIEDSLSPFAGLYFRGLIVGLSYDVNTSSLAAVVPNSNAFEVSISFTGGKKRPGNSVYFNCPRF